MEMIAKRTFKPDRNTLVRSGSTFETSDSKARHYERNGMAVRADGAAFEGNEAVVNDPVKPRRQEAPKRRTQQAPAPRTQAVPSEAAGEAQPSSASRAAQASKSTTARKSTRGRKPKKATPAE